MDKDKFTVRLAYLITVLWTISFFLGIFLPEYNPPPTIHGLMMAVAGGFLAPEALKGLRNEKKQ